MIFLSSFDIRWDDDNISSFDQIIDLWTTKTECHNFYDKCIGVGRKRKEF